MASPVQLTASGNRCSDEGRVFSGPNPQPAYINPQDSATTWRGDSVAGADGDAVVAGNRTCPLRVVLNGKSLPLQ